MTEGSEEKLELVISGWKLEAPALGGGAGRAGSDDGVADELAPGRKMIG